MKNIETIDMANKSELARILAKSEWCDRCLSSCNTEECVNHIKTWMDKECEAEENPPADNEPQQEAPAERTPDKTMINNQPADNVNHPTYYTFGSIEVIDFIEDKKLGFHLGNAVKYISRAGRKDPAKTIEDLRKAAWYLNRQIGRLERELGGQNDKMTK